MTDSASNDDAPRRVRRRHVFYVSGFDPQGPSRYHALYAGEAARQAAVNGMRIDVGRRHNEDAVHAWWPVRAEVDGSEVDGRYEFLRWDDIVRTHWPRNAWTQWIQTLQTITHYLRTGAAARIRRIYSPPFTILMSPAIILLALALSALVAGGVAAALHRAIGTLPAAMGGFVVMAAAFALARWVEKRMQLAWLMRSYAFTVRYAAGAVPAMQQRIVAFGQRIADVIAAGDVDEVLVVGHSSGGQMAVSAVARAIELGGGRGSDRGAQVATSLITLGHCTPILSTLDEAGSFRDDLRLVANTPNWTWVDFTAPADGCCFVLTDPTTGCDAVPGSAQERPKLLSPRFAMLFGRESYARIVRDKMRYHFQYLMAAEKPGAYDYFAITAGVLTLAERFAAHRSVVDYHQRLKASKASKAG
jgi:hypothetical protein